MGKMNFVETIKEIILEQLFPYTCPFCGTVISFRELYCNSCAEKLHWINEQYCARCGKIPCNCEESENQLDGMIAAVEYDPCISKAITNFKYHQYYQYVKAFTKMIILRYEQMEPKEHFDGIVFVPMHPKHQKKREYNHAEVLARSLGTYFSLPVLPLLKKGKQVSMQHFLDRMERKKNAEESYELIRYVDLSGKNLLLCDDIVTTGATMNRCASLLKSCGAEKVYGIAIASTQHKDIENGNYLLYNEEN